VCETAALGPDSRRKICVFPQSKGDFRQNSSWKDESETFHLFAL